MVTPNFSIILPYWCPLKDNIIPNATRRAQDKILYFIFVLQEIGQVQYFLLDTRYIFTKYENIERVVLFKIKQSKQKSDENEVKIWPETRA